jgi:16S rRNA (cytosine967-C5)-methyltransferase
VSRPGDEGGGAPARRGDAAPTQRSAAAAAQAGGVASRIAAYRALRRVHTDGAWSAPAVDAALKEGTLDARDRAFAANLAYETLRWQGSLDWVLARFSSRPLGQLDPEVHDVLRMGAWQILHGRLPERAAVGTAVDVARAEIGQHVTGFVNGVLRNLVRQRDDLPWPSGAGDEAVGLRLGYPAWIVAEARTRFGDRAEAVLAAGNAPPGVTLRATTGDREALLAELRADGIAAEPGEGAPEAVRAPGADPGRLAAVREGRAVVQDESSMLVARAVVDPSLDAPLILDACAGPGGKSTHLAQLGAAVVASELHPARSRLVAEAAGRMAAGTGGDRVMVLCADATAPPLRPGSVDAALIDAPCSGLGVVRRRPELRWKRAAGDPQRLAQLQLDLVDRVTTLVRPGGRVVYSACTWTDAETRQLAELILAVSGDRLELDDTTALLEGAGVQLADDPGVQLAPDTDGTDGMYVLALRRR